MRVCIISPNKKAYSETFIKAHIDRLDKVVDVLYGGHLPTRSIQNDEALLETSNIGRLKRGILTKLQNRSIEELTVSAIMERLTRNEIDVVLAEYGPTGMKMIGPCSSIGIPLVVHFHGKDAYNDKFLDKYREQVKALFSKCAAVVAVSRHMEKRLLGLGAPRNKLHYNLYGVDTDKFCGADPMNSKEHFISIGRFTEKKAPYLLILAFKEVLKEIPQARLTMIGDGALQDPCQKMIKALGLGASISLLGVLPPNEIAENLQRSRAFVQHSLTPSNNDHEGTPLAVLEACASGLPVIATRHGGIPDVVEHGVNGLLSEENDVHEMAKNMIALGQDAELAATLGKASREIALQAFTIERSIEGLQKILLEAAGP